MVRHEAAEALGSIATPSVLESLKRFSSEEEKSQVVRESCVVALDMVGCAFLIVNLPANLTSLGTLKV